MIPTFNPRTLVPGIIIMIAVTFAGIFFYLNSGGKKISIKVFLLYSLATILLFGLVGLTSGFTGVENPLTFFIATQVSFFAFGIANAIMLGYVNNREEDSSVFWHELVFTIYLTLLGGFIYFLLFTWLSAQWQYAISFLWALLFFIIPYFFAKTFEYLIAIPAEEYEKWYYPIDKIFDEIDEDEFDEKKTLILVVNVLGQTRNDKKIVHTKFLAPLRWEFGNWAAFMINNRNESKPGELIEFVDEYGQPQGWYFYVKPKWYQSNRMIDPKLTVSENGLTGNELIIFERA